MIISCLLDPAPSIHVDYLVLVKVGQSGNGGRCRLIPHLSLLKVFQSVGVVGQQRVALSSTHVTLSNPARPFQSLKRSRGFDEFLRRLSQLVFISAYFKKDTREGTDVGMYSCGPVEVVIFSSFAEESVLIAGMCVEGGDLIVYCLLDKAFDSERTCESLREFESYIA